MWISMRQRNLFKPVIFQSKHTNNWAQRTFIGIFATFVYYSINAKESLQQFWFPLIILITCNVYLQIILHDNRLNYLSICYLTS